jgi:hypothetical protein
MRIISIIVCFSILLNAQEYFAKLEPLEVYNVKSSVSGKVIFVDNQIKGFNSVNNTIVKLDSKVDVVELKQTKKKLRIIMQILKIENKILQKFTKISSKSQLDRDNQKIKILNLENQKSDLLIKQAMLEDKIKNKNIQEENNYISNINVKVGDFVNAGSSLYTSSDLSKSKIEIFIPIDKAKEIINKTIYLDGLVTQYKINKLYKVADLKHLSSYKCEIIVNRPKNFSKLVKIEFK